MWVKWCQNLASNIREKKVIWVLLMQIRLKNPPDGFLRFGGAFQNRFSEKIHKIYRQRGDMKSFF